MNLYKTFIRPFLFRLEPENAHKLATDFGAGIQKYGLDVPIKSLFSYSHNSLKTTFCGKEYPNPVGLAAGVDKNALLLDFWQILGFGFVEIGSITAKKSAGNPKPRIFRLTKDNALINRMGLNNEGADMLSIQLDNGSPISYGINIAKTNNPKILGEKAISDFCYSFRRLYPFGNYMVLNISCPNTAEAETDKTFEDPVALDELLVAISKERSKISVKKPVLLKLSPDIPRNPKYLDAILNVAEKRGIGGYIISNTSQSRENLHMSRLELEKIGPGGLSGAPIRAQSTEMIRCVYKHLKEYAPKSRPQIIGVGGIFSAEHAYEKIKAGASLVQVYTGLVYEGPGLVKSIKKGLVELLKKDSLKSLSEAVGVEAG